MLSVISPLPPGEGPGEGSTVYLPCYDGNGNVCEYTDAASAIVAHYEYSPFGETVVQSGDLANALAFRFSTKYWENEAKLYYYGYRFYVPESGRWLNRDPIWERAERNLYGFIKNDPIINVDLLGLTETETGTKPRVSYIERCGCPREETMQLIFTVLREAATATRKSRKSRLLDVDPYTRERKTVLFEFEYSGRICCNKKTKEVYATGPAKGTFRDESTGKLDDDPFKLLFSGHNVTPTSENVMDNKSFDCKPDFDSIAIYHSHPSSDTAFSPGDLGLSKTGLVLMLAADGTEIIGAINGNPLPPVPLPPETEEDTK